MLKLLRHQGIFHIDFDCFIKKNHLSWRKCSFELCNPSTVLVALAFCSLMWHPCSINTLFLRLYSTDQCLTVFWKVMLYFFSFRKRGSDRPTADSLAQMLIQALHSQDNSLMEVRYCEILHSCTVKTAHTVIKLINVLYLHVTGISNWS